MLNFILDVAAEWTVAKRENRQLGQISRKAWLSALVAVVLTIYGLAFLINLIWPAQAHAAPACAAYGTCQYLPSGPGPNGPLMPTWNTPGTYGGWTTNTVQCSSTSYSCQQVTEGDE